MKTKTKCLVIQLASTGDVLQTLMALRAAKQLYPDIAFHLLVRESFSAPAKKVPWLASVYTLPTDQILKPALGREKDEAKAIKKLAHWLIPLVEEPWDMVINWTFSEVSSYITGLLPSKIKLGYSCEKDGTFYATDGWSHYMQAFVQENVRQNIHLTDILTTQLLTALQIHLGDPEANGNSPVTSKYFFSLKLTEEELKKLPEGPPEGLENLKYREKKWITIQLSTGNLEKAWDPKRWAELAEKILINHENFGIMVLGGQNDVAKAETFFESLSPQFRDSTSILPIVGNTSFDLWASAISLSSWTFSSETAAVHLASVLGTRVLEIALGTTRFYEAGPYGNGHFVIRPKPSSSSKADLSADDVYQLWNQVLNQPDLTVIEPSSNLYQVYRSKIRQTSDGGGVTYQAMIPEVLDLEGWSSMVFGHIARSWYCGWTPDIGKEIQRSMINPQLIQKLRELKETAEIFGRIYEKAYQTASDLKNRSSHLKSEKLMGVQDREEINKLGNSLVQLESLCERLIQVHPMLKSFLNMTKVLMHHLDGDHISEISKEAAQSYQQISEGVVILKAWIDHTLNLVKPFAIEKPARPEVQL